MSYEEHFQDAEIARAYEVEEYRRGSYNQLLSMLEVKMIRCAFDWNGSDPLNLVDFACGTGRFLPVLADLAENVVGVDVSIQMLEIAAGKASENVELLQADVRLAEDRARLRELSPFNGGCALRFILNAERAMAVDCLRAVADQLEPGAPFLVNNHSRPVSHKAWSAIRNWFLRRRPVVGNTLSDHAASSIFGEAGFTIVTMQGYGILGARAASLVGVKMAHIVEERLPKWILLVLGSHRMYVLSRCL